MKCWHVLHFWLDTFCSSCCSHCSIARAKEQEHQNANGTCVEHSADAKGRNLNHCVNWTSLTNAKRCATVEDTTCVHSNWSTPTSPTFLQHWKQNQKGNQNHPEICLSDKCTGRHQHCKCSTEGNHNEAPEITLGKPVLHRICLSPCLG